MKTNLFKNAFIACVSIAFIAVVFTACSKSNDSVTTADQTKLTALADSCTTLLSSTTVATDYPAASITAFQTVLTNAKAAAAVTTITQTAVDNLVVNLRAAKTTFLAAAYGAIPSSALLMGMTFDETVASNQFTTEGKGWTAVLKTGPSEIFGTATNLPSFVTGKIGKAMYFSNGSHLEINNYVKSDLLNSKLSISVWVSPDSTKGGNYILSYNYWKTWKFQVQENQKPCFTTKTTGGVTDADNQLVNSVPNKTWTHLVVSMDLTAGTLTFYVNGVSTMVWTSTTKPTFTGTLVPYANTIPLMVGACTTYTEALVGFDWTGWNKPSSWDGFVGSIDELKLYNIALTDGQVAKMYKDENK